MKPLAEGLLLLDSSLKPLYANAEAISLLAYPQKPPPTKSLYSFLSDKIQSVLLTNASLPQSGFVTEIKSGRRHYLCRAFSLDSHASSSPGIALLIGRRPRSSFDCAQIAKRFHLTQRERETVECLMQGLTNKEIAVRMKVSPNTVKSFLRLIMVKMGASTRSGIIGKIFDATH